MNQSNHASVAYLATLGAIVLLTTIAALVVAFVDAETHLAQIVAALGFIGAAVTGLIGVIGTFRPKGESPAGTPSDPVSTKDVEGEQS